MCDSKSEIAPAEFAVENVDVDDTNVEEVMDADCKQLESGPGTRSGSIATSSMRGGKTSLKKSRGRNKKVGSFTKSAFSKGRGRRSVLKKQVKQILFIHLLITGYIIIVFSFLCSLPKLHIWLQQVLLQATYSTMIHTTRLEILCQLLMKMGEFTMHRSEDFYRISIVIKVPSSLGLFQLKVLHHLS